MLFSETVVCALNIMTAALTTKKQNLTTDIGLHNFGHNE